MTEIFTPRPHQQKITEHLIKNKRSACWCFMGGGKSASVLEALIRLQIAEDVFPALIIAPLRVARSVWPEEIRKWQQFRHLKISVVVGDAKERLRALFSRADIYVINQENILWLIEKLNGQWPYKTIVFDESSRLSGFRLRQGTKRAKALAKVAFRSPRFIELTGTPAPNSIAQMWGQLFFLDKGERLGRTFTAFRDRWFTQSYDGFSIIPLPHAQKEIEVKIKDLCLSIRAEDYFPVDEPIKTVIPVKLPPDTQKQYKKMEKEMFASISGKEIEAFNAAARTNKCLQFANGCVYYDDKKNSVEIHREKINALESIIEEANGAPVLVAYHFKSDLERLLKAFPQGKHLDKDPKTVKDWNEGKIPVLFLHPASAGHGLSLQHGGNILVFFSITWDLELFDQTVERVGTARQKQSGYDRPVFLYFILAENTIEYAVLERLKSKKSVQEILLKWLAK